MEDTKKLAVAYGSFACVVEGFDHPFPVMRKVVRYFQELSEKDPDFAGYRDIEDFAALRDKLAESANGSELTLEPIAGGVHIRRFDHLDESRLESDPVPEALSVATYETEDGPQDEAAHDDTSQDGDAPQDLGAQEFDAEETEAFEAPVAETADEQPHDSHEPDHAPWQAESSEADHGTVEPDVSEDQTEDFTQDATEEVSEAASPDALIESADADADADADEEASTDHDSTSEDHPAEVRADADVSSDDGDESEAEPETPEAQPEDDAHHHPWHGDSMMFGDSEGATNAAEKPDEAEAEVEPLPETEPAVASTPEGDAAEPDPLPEESQEVAAAHTEPSPDLADTPAKTPIKPAPLRFENPEIPQPTAVETDTAAPAVRPVSALRLGPELAIEGEKPEAEVPPTPSFIDTVEEPPAPKGGLFRSKPAVTVPEQKASAKVETPVTTEKPAEAEETGRRGFRLGGLLRRKSVDAAAKQDKAADAASADPAPAQKPAGGKLRLVEGGTTESAPEILAQEPATPKPLKPEPLKPEPVQSSAEKASSGTDSDPLRSLLSGKAEQNQPAAKPGAATPAAEAPKAAQAPAAKSGNAMKDRLHASFGGLPEPAPTAVTLVEGDSDPSTPAGFARAVGASSLPEMMAAAAGYMTMIEGADRISRAQIMSMVQAISGGATISAEAKVKAFGKLVRSGELVRGEGGSFFLSAESAQDYQERLNELV